MRRRRMAMREKFENETRRTIITRTKIEKIQY
jgi:hypothetical protein